jgi:hypothetical protein
MLFHDVQERAALRNLAERDDETTEALESFLLDHYATLHPHADYLMQIVKNVLAITGSYYFCLPRVKKMQFSEPHRQCLQSSLCHEDMGVATAGGGRRETAIGEALILCLIGRIDRAA